MYIILQYNFKNIEHSKLTNHRYVINIEHEGNVTLNRSDCETFGIFPLTSGLNFECKEFWTTKGDRWLNGISCEHSCR